MLYVNHMIQLVWTWCWDIADVFSFIRVFPSGGVCKKTRCTFGEFMCQNPLFGFTPKKLALRRVDVL